MYVVLYCMYSSQLKCFWAFVIYFLEKLANIRNIGVIVIDSIEGKKYLDTNTEIVIDWFFLFRKELSIACQCRNIQRVNDKNFFRKSLLETIMYCPFADS